MRLLIDRDEIRSTDQGAIETTLQRLQDAVDEHRRTHQTDTGIKNRLARIYLLKSMLNKI